MNLARQLPDCSRGAIPGEFDGLPRCVTVESAVYLFNMFGGGSSKSSEAQTSQQVAASEGSLAVGAGGKFLESGSIDLSGASNPELGTKLEGENITINSAEVLKTALAAYNEQAKAAVEAYRDQSLSSTSAFSAFAKQLEEQKSEDLATALASIGQLKQTTDEAAQQRKTFLYLMLGVLAVLAVLFFPWSKVK